MVYDGYQSDDRQSEEVQSAYKKVSGGDEEIRGFGNLDETEEQNLENEWSWVPQENDSGSWVPQESDSRRWVPQENDSLAESISSLDKTQEVLERFFKKNEALEMGKLFSSLTVLCALFLVLVWTINSYLYPSCAREPR
jgi:hypothetical protein